MVFNRKIFFLTYLKLKIACFYKKLLKKYGVVRFFKNLKGFFDLFLIKGNKK
jgi:hypothetical protein